MTAPIPDETEARDRAAAYVAGLSPEQYAAFVAETRPPDEPLYPASWQVPGRTSR